MRLDKADVPTLYDPVVQDIKASGLRIRFILADAKERKRLLGMGPVTCTFPCECCEAKCVRGIKPGTTKTKIYFPM